MLDFESLPPFESNTAYFRQAGVRPSLFSLAVSITTLSLFGVGVGPWIGCMLGRIPLIRVDDELFSVVADPVMLLYLSGPIYLAWSGVRLQRLFKRNKDFALLATHGPELLRRGDDLAESVERLRRISRYVRSKYVPDPSATPAPGTFEEHLLERLRTDWYAVRKEAWTLHAQQQDMRIRHAR